MVNPSETSKRIKNFIDKEPRLQLPEDGLSFFGEIEDIARNWYQKTKFLFITKIYWVAVRWFKTVTSLSWLSEFKHVISILVPKRRAAKYRWHKAQQRPENLKLFIKKQRPSLYRMKNFSSEKSAKRLSRHCSRDLQVVKFWCIFTNFVNPALSKYI